MEEWWAIALSSDYEADLLTTWQKARLRAKFVSACIIWVLPKEFPEYFPFS